MDAHTRLQRDGWRDGETDRRAQAQALHDAAACFLCLLFIYIFYVSCVFTCLSLTHLSQHTRNVLFLSLFFLIVFTFLTQLKYHINLYFNIAIDFALLNPHMWFLLTSYIRAHFKSLIKGRLQSISGILVVRNTILAISRHINSGTRELAGTNYNRQAAFSYLFRIFHQLSSPFISCLHPISENLLIIDFFMTYIHKPQ